MVFRNRLLFLAALVFFALSACPPRDPDDAWPPPTNPINRLCWQIKICLP